MVDPEVIVHDPSIPDLAQRGLEAAQAGQWIVLTAILVMALVAAVRKYGGDRWETLSRGYSAFVVSMLLGMATQIVTAASSGMDLSKGAALIATLINGAATGLAASGIYSGGKALAERGLENDEIRLARRKAIIAAARRPPTLPPEPTL